MVNITSLPVNSLWIGSELSYLELLTLQSFIYHGHEFNLWTYEPLGYLPSKVSNRDAGEILPVSSVFRRRFKADGLSIGKDSLALFSDLFRFKLLLEIGGWWVDMDMTCLRALDFTEDYVFRPHDKLAVMGNIVKSPKGSLVMRETYKEVAAEVDENTKDWLAAQKIFARHVEKQNLLRFRRTLCNEDLWPDIFPRIYGDLPAHPDWYVFHWCNEQWRSKGINKNSPPPGGYLEQLLLKYSVK